MPVFPAGAARIVSPGRFSESESNSLLHCSKYFLDDLPELAIRPMSCKQGIRPATIVLHRTFALLNSLD
jgi:hypothetical protein